MNKNVAADEATYSFEDVGNLEKNIQRIIYVWRRYQGCRTPFGKVFSREDMEDLKNSLKFYLDNPHKFIYESIDKPEEQ